MPLNAELRFWRTKSGDEIDFIYLKNRIPYIIEVKSKLKKAFEKSEEYRNITDVTPIEIKEILVF